MTTERQWQNLAYLYQTEQLDLSEITKAAIIFTVAGFFGDEKDVLSVGINVIDNTAINSALVFGIISALPDDESISYPYMGKLLLMHPSTIGRAVKRLVKDEIVSKQDYGSAGSLYTIEETPNYPKWIFLFSAALIEVENKKIHFG